MAEEPNSRPPGDVWTVGRIIDWTTQHLKKHGSPTPRLDTEILLAHVRGCRRIQLYTNFDTPLTDAERAAMRTLVQRRAQAEPVAYLVGHREFFSLEMRVTADVLIPRPETELLVLAALEQSQGLASPGILDLCTGSGCVAIACAVRAPNAQVTAVDISPAALAVAQENAATHRVDRRVRFLTGDLFAPLASGELFDIIVSNPPYVSTTEWDSLPPDVRHEPRLALEAGPDGLSILRRIIQAAPHFLKPGGLLALEFSPEQAPAVLQLAEESHGYSHLQIQKDVAGLQRMLRGTRVPGGNS